MEKKTYIIPRAERVEADFVQTILTESQSPFAEGKRQDYFEEEESSIEGWEAPPSVRWGDVWEEE